MKVKLFDYTPTFAKKSMTFTYMNSWKTQHRIFVSLLIMIFALVGIISVKYDYAWDLTVNNRNQLSDTSVEIVSKLKEPLHITAFTRGNPSVKTFVNRLLSRYQKHADISWTFKNPDSEIDIVKQYGISRDGELLITYQGKTLKVSSLSETAITRGIYLSLVGRVRHAVFLTGHGELGFSDNDDGLSKLKQHLATEEIKVSQIDLKTAKQIPDNADILIIAAPQFALSEEITQILIDYIDDGGRLLWLSDNEHIKQPFLSSYLGVTFESGYIMGNAGKDYGLKNSAYVPIVQNAKTPSLALKGIDTFLVFVQANPLVLLPTEQSQQWDMGQLFQAHGDWLLKSKETITKVNKHIILGVELMPKIAQSATKKKGIVWLIGDADFITNGHINKGQNSDFTLNTFRYLAEPETGHIQIDRALPPLVTMSEEQLAHFALLLVIGMPLLMMILGFFVRRRLLR